MMQSRMQLQQLYSVLSGGLCALDGGEAIAVEGAAVGVGEDPCGLGNTGRCTSLGPEYMS